MQVVWNIGRALEKFILVTLSTEGVGEVSGLTMECVETAQQDTFVKKNIEGQQTMWNRLRDDLFIARDIFHDEERVLELTELLSTHRKARLHVRTLPGDSHHKITVFLFDALCCGSSAYWSIKELLASLGIERNTSYIARHSKGWYQAGLQYELDYMGTTGKSDTTVMKHIPSCTELVILLLARWSFLHKKAGGFSDKTHRSACELFLGTLCKALHGGQTMKMPFCLRPDVKRHDCNTIVGKDVVFISVQQDGIVDLSELRAQGPSNKVARMWLHHLDMKFGCEDIYLVDLLRWSVTSAFPQLGRKTFHMQMVWNIGRALEKFILVNLSAKGAGEISGLRLQCEVSPSAVKQTMEAQATHQDPFSIQKQARDTPTDQPAKRSHPAPSVQKTGSQNHATDRPAKKRATQHLVAVRQSMPE